jgi:hypothetical protein
MLPILAKKFIPIENLRIARKFKLIIIFASMNLSQHLKHPVFKVTSQICAEPKLESLCGRRLCEGFIT